MTVSNRNRQARGGAPVGVLAELPPVELAAIRYLRLWFSGKQDRIWRDFHNQLSNRSAKKAMVSFTGLMDAVQFYARRPLLRHDDQCDCFGGDECAFAHFVAASCSGNSHDAMTFGLHLFDSEQTEQIIATAAICGQVFSNMAGLALPYPHSSIGRSSPGPTHPMPKATQ